MYAFNVIFQKNNIEFELPVEVFSEHDIQVRWFACLVDQIQTNNQVLHKTRLYNFPDNLNEQYYIDEINKQIDIINKYDSTTIPLSAYIGMPPSVLNNLHYFFVKLRGEILDPAPYWMSCTNEQKLALDDFNLIIHKAENFYTNDDDNKNARIVVDFHDIVRRDLQQEDYQHFTIKKTFGDVFINYCEVGKPINDLVRDDDDLTEVENVKPLRYYSPDFSMCFRTRSQEEYDNFYKKLDVWWEKNRSNLVKLNLSKNDPMNAIGMIPVGKIKTDLDEDQLVHKLAGSIIDRVEIS